MSAAKKFTYLTLGAICVLLGVIGLLIPIVPGVLFLAAAVYLGSKASRRVRHYLDANPHIREQRRRLHGFEGLRGLDRLKLAAWMTLDSMLQGLQTLVRWGSQTVRGLSRRPGAR